MEGLTEGRIVHFVMPDGQHRAAIVVRVWYVNVSTGPEPLKEAPANGCCNLTVFPDWTNDGSGIDAAGLLWRTSVCYSEEPKPNTWHWIERA